MKGELTKEELKELVGGQLSLQLNIAPDVNNLNCDCVPNNQSIITNSNTIVNCHCNC